MEASNHDRPIAAQTAGTERSGRIRADAADRSLRITADDLGLPSAVECPFCAGLKTELHSGFGSQLSVATYWCRTCHTAFEWIKWQDR